MISLQRTFAKLAIAFLAITSLSSAAFAEGGENGSQGAYSSRGGSPWATYYRYLEENPELYAEADKTFPNGQVDYGEQGQTKKNVPGPTIPGKIWPIVTQPYVPQGPEKTMNWARSMDRITNYSQPNIGSPNLSPAFAALSMGVAGQMLADELQSPQATMPRAREEQNQQIQQSADNTAAMERQQAGCAIDFVASYLYNFTVEEGNKWNQVRNQLFLPMALLLLLPGAVLAQVKSVAAQGFSVLGDINPFDGLMRAVIAIFLIPGTYLVVNYGIDVANSITKVVAQEYQKTFGTNMYEDAMCAHIRAFPFREPIENKNFVPNAEAKMGRLSPNNTPFAELEGKMINIKLTDPCAKLNIVPADRANEQVKYSVNAQRNAYNTANAALAMAWNILCAFQMAYLYYLWFVGPVVAALWVYPMKQLRDAFGSWCEGVITICFWSLFWSTVVLLMACFRGVDETGTIIMTALNFLATACVKFAFDFAGLVKDAGREAGRMAEKMAGAAASGGKGANSGAHNQQGAQQGTNGGHGANGTGPNGQNGAPNSPPSGDELNTGSNSGFAMGQADGADGAGGALSRGLSTGSADINGHVSMAGFPHPPLAGHHSNALGVVGTALGGAGLWTGIAAMAQPHFMHQPGGVGGSGDPGAGGVPGTGGGGTGVAGSGSSGGTDGQDGDDGRSARLDGIGGLDVVNDGDMYEHNWGETAANAPLGSISLDPDGPPLATIPATPAMSLTPTTGMPPNSSADGFGGAAGTIAANGAATPGSGLAADIIANSNTGAPIPGNGSGPAHVGHDIALHGAIGAHGDGHAGAGHAGAGHAGAGHAGVGGHAGVLGHGEHHAGAHNEHHSGAHGAGHGPHHADPAHANAMFRDSLLAQAAANGSLPPAYNTSTFANTGNAMYNSSAASYINSNDANFNNTNIASNAAGTSVDYNSTNSAQQQYVDYNVANNNAAAAAASTTAAGGFSNALGYGTTDAGASNNSGYDPSAASFSALAQSVAGDSVSAIGDDSYAYSDPGISTAAAAGDYSTTTYGADYSSSYGTDYSPTFGSDYSATYGTDVSASYGTDYSSTYASDYSSVVDDSTIVDGSSYVPPSISTSVSASLNSIPSSGSDSYTSALSAGGFVAPAPDSGASQVVNASSLNSTNLDVSSNNADIYNTAAQSTQNMSFNSVDTSQVTSLNASSQPSVQPQIDASQSTQQQSQYYASQAASQYVTPSNGAPDTVLNNATNAANAANAATVGNPGISAAVGAGSAALANSIAFQNAQQQLRNQLAQDPHKQAGAQPNQLKKPAVGPGLPGSPGGKQSALGAAVGKAGVRTPQNSQKQPMQGKPLPVVKPAASKGSLQDSVEQSNTRNRYIQPGKLTPEEQAELEAKARMTGSWMPTEQE